MEWLGLAGVMASALGLVLTVVFGFYAFWVNGPRTRGVIERGDQRTQEMFQRTQEMIERGYQRTQEMTERGDQRAREMFQRTQELIDQGQQQTREMMNRTQEMIREMHADTQRTLEKMDGTLHHLADLIEAEGERTREEIRARRS